LSGEVKVLRDRPRDRSKCEGLCGILYTTLLCESYIHVGSSQTPLIVIDEDLLTKLIKSGKRDIKVLLQVGVKIMKTSRFDVSNGRPIIPGSSIKGNIRSRLELSFRAKDGTVRSCFIRADKPLIKEPLKGERGWRHFKIWDEVLFEKRGSPCDMTKGNMVCLICDLFGTSGLKSLVDFSDFVGEGREEDMLKELSLEYGIKLVAAKPDSRFNGKIVFHSLRPHELGLLLIGMKVGNSVLLGRLKYRHKISGITFGKARYEVKAMELLEESQDLEVDGLRVKGGERVEGERLAKIVEGLRSLAKKEFKDEIVEVDEVTIVEKL